MTSTCQDAAYTPDHAIAEITDILADKVEAATFPETKLRFRNDQAAAEIGLSSLSDEAWVAHFGRFEALPDAQPHPLALRYHGHQFRNYNPDIGDGRGFLFAQLRDRSGRLIDLGTKGSGQTPYSRFGDGRLTLKGAVREVLATEMLEAQGVSTSRTLSVIETGEQLHRGDEPSPTRSAVLVRQNHGHIRIGSFQRLAYLGDKQGLARLVAYSLKHYFPQADPEGGARLLLREVVKRTARLAAQFMAAGFVHGVLNTDNINITGESFDYGPWRWAPTYDTRFTAAYFDESGLYAFGRQPEAIHWNVAQLAISLTLIIDQEDLIPELEQFADQYRSALVESTLKRLNCASRGSDEDAALTQAVIQSLAQSQTPLDQFCFDWAKRDLDIEAYAGPAFSDAKQLIHSFDPITTLQGRYWEGAQPISMLIDDVEAIWARIAEEDDWSKLHAKISDIREMRAVQAQPQSPV